MSVVRWNDGRVSATASVEVPGRLTGARLRDSYADVLRALTFGFVSLPDNSIRLGPIELLRFGKPAVSRSAVDWPIEGGLLAGGPGGRWRIESSRGQVRATVDGYRPALPRPVYVVSHLQVHQLFTRLYLLRLRGAEPPPGEPAQRRDRLRAAAVDVAMCFTLARFAGRRRPGRLLLVTAAYHVACWSLAGRTLGGLVIRQRVVAYDGSRLTPTQSMLRLALTPLSWLRGRPLHDEIACTTVIRD
ncbi:MAG TPA: RDD family protein [Candidatus Limnocylindrales bacterium]|nr:RDD family protein [Candidatus Limnocylindrales bacterium]